MSVTIKGLRERRAQLAEEAADILKKASDDSRDLLKSDEQEHYEKVHLEIDALTKNIELRERQDDIERKLADPQPRQTTPNPVPSDDTRARNPGDSESFAIARHRRGQEDYSEALRSWFLAGSPYRPPAEAYERARKIGVDLNQKQLTINLSTRSMRTLDGNGWEYRVAQGTGSGGIGGFTVPDEAMRALEVALLAFGGMRQGATVLRTSTGADLPFPLVDDTSNQGALVGENTTQTELGVTFTQLVLNTFKYTSKYILVSVELLQDSAINVPEYIGRALGERIGRITNNHFTVGDGSAKPRGIVVAATSGKVGTTGQTTTITYPDLVDLEHSVDIAYRRPGGAFMMNDAMLKTIKKLVDTQQRPLWLPGIAVREPDTILGYPYIVNNDMAVPAANAKSLLFGALSKYLIRDVLDIQLLRLDELFALYQQVCFLAFSRHDGDLLDAGTHPVKYYANSAT